MSERPRKNRKVEAVILAGGRSSRMGRDKARMRFGGRSLLARVRAAALDAGLPVSVLRRDAVPRCGPLGGVLTALRRTRADMVIFLSCDMPLIGTTALRRLARARAGSFFADNDGVVGFPFSVATSDLPVIEDQIARSRFSLQRLATVLRARRLAIPKRAEWQWFNVNTPAEFAEARRLWKHHLRRGRKARLSRR